jgi:localization factor PodJL
LRQAALSGDAAALYEIAAQAADGRGMAQDMVTAARFFERASQAGLPPAQERLAMLHEKGAGVPRDLKQAAFWYERAALGGNIRAMHNLATLLVSGATGKPDYPAALRWYGEAAEAGFRDSQFNMGLLLARGIGSNRISPGPSTGSPLPQPKAMRRPSGSGTRWPGAWGGRPEGCQIRSRAMAAKDH